MTETKMAIVTPSYAPDLNRCSLMTRGVNEFVDPSIRHHIAVERRELIPFSGSSRHGLASSLKKALRRREKRTTANA